jgi:outer membrane immunogenic protein
MAYVTGGWAWADVKYSGTVSSAGQPTTGLNAVSFTSTRSGPVVGAGYEWMITPNWTLRGEFLHYWFDDTTNAASTPVSIGPGVTVNAAYTWSRFDVNVARLALNYKF